MTTGRLSALRILGCAMILPTIIGTTLMARPKTDVLVMKNGDRITCEIVKLEYGQLHIKTSYSIGTIVLDWKEIEHVESKQTFWLQSGSGEQFTGAVTMDAVPEKSSADQEINVTGETQSVPLRHSEIVDIRQIETNLWSRFDGGVDAGLGLTKANSQTNFNLSGDLTYTGRNFDVALSQKSYFSSTRDAPQTSRYEGSASYTRYRHKYFVRGLTNFLSNEEQKLDLRFTGGGGIGRYFQRTNKNVVTGSFGLVLNNERFSPETGKQVVNNLEALIAGEYYTFRFDASEFKTAVLVFPSVTDPGRFRIAADFNLYWKISGRLKWSVGVTNNFDSRPPGGTPRNDYVLTSSIRVDLR